ncbi:MAG: metal-dependent hydrolase [Pirellulales bacterium]
MADFKTHMTVSTVTGAVLGFAGWKASMPIDTCVVAGTLCSVSGMLPDLDSNSGRPLREATALGAAVIPMLMVDRLQKMELKQDTMVLIAIIAYVVIRFVLAEIFRRYTVHRGMWHSIPAAAICGMVAFLVMSHEDITIRLFKTSGVVLGFMSHLILDEIWSIDFRGGSYKFKSSFGTAIKFWGGSRFANVVTYAKLAIIGTLVWQDQGFMAKYHMDPNVPHTMSEMIASLKTRYQKAKDVVEDIGNRIPGLGDDADSSTGQAGLAAQNGSALNGLPGQAGLNQGDAQRQQLPGNFALPAAPNFGGNPVSSNPPTLPGNGQGFGGNSPAPSKWQ